MQVSINNNFPCRPYIFSTKSDFFSEFNADTERFKILVLLLPILIRSADVSTQGNDEFKLCRKSCRFTCLP